MNLYYHIIILSVNTFFQKNMLDFFMTARYHNHEFGQEDQVHVDLT